MYGADARKAGVHSTEHLSPAWGIGFIPYWTVNSECSFPMLDTLPGT